LDPYIPQLMYIHIRATARQRAASPSSRVAWQWQATGHSIK
jgi:hypothetical protein